MMTIQTAADDFSYIKNGIDNQLEIIQHNKTGFYNITKTAKMIAKQLEFNNENNKNNESDGIPSDSNKLENLKNNEFIGIPIDSNKLKNPCHWFENATTNSLIDECKKQTKLDEVYFKIKKGVAEKYSGTYVHRLLYDHFLAWLDSRYAIKISVILDKIRQEANLKLLKEKDDAFNRLELAFKKHAEESKARDNEAKARDEAQSAEIKNLLSYTKDTVHELSEARLDIKDANNNINKLNDKVEECREIIIDRMEEHTINPSSTTKLQYFTCLQHPDWNNVLYAIRSQKSNIKKQIKAHSDWDIIIKPIEDPNSIKMFNRFRDRVNSIEKSWKTEIRMLYCEGEFDKDTRDAKLQYIIDNPLISINRNNIEFDTGRISLKKIIKLMKDTSFERFKLSVP